MNDPRDGINLGPVYDSHTVGPQYDASTGPMAMYEGGLAVGGNQDPPKPTTPKPRDLDSDEPNIIDRK